MSLQDLESKATAVQKRDVHPAARALELAMGGISQLLPRQLTVERMQRLSLGILRTNKQLNVAAKDNPHSFVAAVVSACKLGLEPGIDAHLVPFKNRKTGVTEIQFIPDYRGLLKLARQSGEVTAVQVNIVYDQDEFSMELGLEDKVKHVPKTKGDRGEILLVYGVAKFKDGSHHFEWMSKDSIDKIRAGSKASDTGPWKTDYEEMARKTLVRRICKYLPRTLELDIATKVIDAHEEGKRAVVEGDVVIIDGDLDEETPPTKDTPEPNGKAE